jgi:hypothetical protein
VFLVWLVTIKARIVAAKRLTGTRMLPGGAHLLTFFKTQQIKCGSGLARDGGGTSSILVV